MAGQTLGQIHVYTGKGKGKTTAAIGQAVRCAGAGLKIIMVNFFKNSDSSEFKALKHLNPNFEYVIANQEHRGFYWEMSEDQIEATWKDYQAVWLKVQNIIDRHQCDLLILDEIMAVIEYGIIPVDSVTAVMKQCKDAHIELILTGRNAPADIVHGADLVTEMNELKHPLSKGIGARVGIEY